MCKIRNLCLFYKNYSCHLVSNIIPVSVALVCSSIILDFKSNYLNITMYFTYFYSYTVYSFTILLMSMLSTIFVNFLKKKNQPLPIVVVGLPVFNVVPSNDTMITMKRIIGFSVLANMFIAVWGLLSFYTGFLAFSFVLFFFLILNLIPPSYFIGRRDKLKAVIFILKEMVE